MENKTPTQTDKITRLNYWPGYFIAIIGLFIFLVLVFVNSKFLFVSQKDYIVYYSSFLIVYAGLIIYLSICRHKDHILEQQYLQWQIIIWKEHEEGRKATAHREETAKKKNQEESMQKEVATDRREAEAKQQAIEVYFKFLECSKGDMNELERMLSGYETYMKKFK